MTAYPFDWVDAFSDRAFGGNGCAVVHGGASLEDGICTAFVRETSLVECTFTGPSDVADIRVRYFLASHEIPFAGHPTIATVAAMRSRGMIDGTSLTLETGAGIIPVTLDGDLIEMTQVAPSFGTKAEPASVAAAVGLSADDIVAPPQVVSTGLPFCITLLRDKDALRRARANPEA
ncbi:MAG: PhzF family phenazine biosynthesis isomerase, partial [Pseudomonadota bacterium]